MRPKRLAMLAVLLAPVVAGATTHFSSGSTPSARRTVVRDTTGCLDTLHASDSVSAVVTMSVRPQDRKTTLPPDFEGLFVQEFRSRLKVPNNLSLSVMAGWAPCDSVSQRCVGGVLTLGSQAYLTAHPTGTLSRFGVIDFSLTPVTIPHYKLPFTFAAWPKKAKGPKYPYIAETRGVGDSVAVTFTVLPDGTVAPQSVDVQAGNYMDFIRSVFDGLATMSYVPARIGSCPVATWTAQTFIFKMR